MVPHIFPYPFDLEVLEPLSDIYSYMPSANKQKSQADTGLPVGWEVRFSWTKKHPYYFNESQKQSIWVPPPGTNTERLEKFLAKGHIATQVKHHGPVNENVSNEGKVRVRHLLVKHRDSRRPSSWREVSQFSWQRLS